MALRLGILIFILAAVAPVAEAHSSLPHSIQAQSDSLWQREEDSVIALRKVLNAFRLTLGLGGDFSLRGLAGDAMLSYQHDRNLYTVRYLTGGTYNAGGLSTRSESETEYSVMFGRAYASPHLFLSASAGLGYVAHYHDGDILDSTSPYRISYQQLRSNTIGVAYQAQVMWTFRSVFGAGLTVFGNINTQRSNFGVLFNYQFGDWYMRDADPDSESFSGPREARNSIYLELGGGGGFVSANYDRLVSEHISISGGVSYFPDLLMVPVMLHVLLMNENSGAEFGCGVTPQIAFAPDVEKSGVDVVTLFAGYRYQAFHGGDFIRVGFSAGYFISDKLFYGAPTLCGGFTF